MKSKRPFALGNHIPMVYVMAPGWDGPCKIGYSNNIKKRLVSVQTSCWEPLSIYAFRVGVWKDSFKGYRHTHASVLGATQALEAAAHKALIECDLHLHGEWFDVTVEEAKAVLDKCGERERIHPLTVERLAAGYIGAADISETVEAQAEILRSMMGPAQYMALHQPYPVDRASVSG